MGTLSVAKFDNGNVVMEIDYVDGILTTTLVRIRHNGSRANARMTLIHSDRSPSVDHTVVRNQSASAAIPAGRRATLVDTGSGLDLPAGFFVQCSYPA